MANLDGAITLAALEAGAALGTALHLDGDVVLPALVAGADLGVTVSHTLDGSIDLPPLVAGASLAGALVVAAQVSLPSLEAGATLATKLRARMECEWSLSAAVRSDCDATWWMVSRDAVRAFAGNWSLSLPRRAGWTVDYFGPRRPAMWGASWSIRLGLVWQASCGIGTISSTWAASYGALATKGWSAAWQATRRLQEAFSTAWGTPQRLQGILALDWGRAEPVRAAQGLGWSLTAGRAARTWSGLYAASERVRVRGAMRCAWRLLPDAAEGVRAVPALALTCGAEALKFERISLLQSRDDGLWRLTARLLQPPPALHEAVVLTVGATAYTLVVTSASAGQQEATDGTWELRAASPPAAWSALPLQDRDDVELPYRGLASAIAAQIAAPLTVAWSLPDWQLEPPVVAAQLHGLSAWDALQALAGAAGGMVLCNPAGTELSAAPFDGSDLGHFAGLEMDRELQAPEQSGARVASHTVADRIRVEGEGRVRDVWVTPFPWRDVAVRQVGAGVLTFLDVQTFEVEEELVPITRGVGHLGEPVHKLLAAHWHGGEPGALRWRAGEADLWLDAPVDGLVTVQYLTRALRFRLASPDGEPANIIVEDQA